MNVMPTCFFIGHRDAPESLMIELEDAIECHILQYGVREFVVGQYGRFDGMAAKAVRKAKQRYDGIRLTLLLAYYNSKIMIPEGFEDSLYPEGMERVPKHAAIVRVNRYMIDHSDYIIAYDMGRIGNTREMLQYAIKRKKMGRAQIQNLWKET